MRKLSLKNTKTSSLSPILQTCTFSIQCSLADSDQCLLFPVAPNPHNGDAGIMDQVGAASLIFRALPDPLVTPEEEFNASYFWDELQSKGLYIDIKTSHVAWLTGVSQTIRIPQRTMVAWLKRHFGGQTDLEEYFTGGIMQDTIDKDKIEFLNFYNTTFSL